MATVTDLTGNQNTTDDDKSVQIADDSNVNVFEFGNLILADILPTIIWLINYLSDMEGTALSEDDKAGNLISAIEIYLGNSEVYGFDEFSYNQANLNYDGVRVQGAIVDISGS